MQKISETERLQKEHYDEIAASYELHYADKCSKRYMDEFLHDQLAENLNLKGLRALDAMCGSGQTAEYLVSKGAIVTGLDISQEVISSFQKRLPECDAICSSIFDSKIDDKGFDCVFVIGGLHHLQPNVNEAIDEIHRILKPGGYFCFAEPVAGNFLDRLRRLWYKHDNLFERNEKAIDIDELISTNFSRFDFIKTDFRGNIAYLLVYNSMVLRVPLGLKRFYTPLVLPIERALNLIPGKGLSCQVICQWRKK